MATSSLPPQFNPPRNYSCHHISSDSSVSDFSFSIQAAESNCHRGFPPNYQLGPSWNLGEPPSWCPSIARVAHTVLWLFSPTLAACWRQPDRRASPEPLATRLLFRHVAILCFRPGCVRLQIPTFLAVPSFPLLHFYGFFLPFSLLLGPGSEMDVV